MAKLFRKIDLQIRLRHFRMIEAHSSFRPVADRYLVTLDARDLADEGLLPVDLRLNFTFTSCPVNLTKSANE